MTDAESIQHQLDEWVTGRPWHNTVRDECCPDFSCCRPDMLWPEEKRQAFSRATEAQRELMLFGSLGDLISTATTEVHIAGVQDIETEGGTQ